MFEFHIADFITAVLYSMQRIPAPDSTNGEVGMFVVREEVSESTLSTAIAYE